MPRAKVQSWAASWKPKVCHGSPGTYTPCARSNVPSGRQQAIIVNDKDEAVDDDGDDNRFVPPKSAGSRGGCHKYLKLEMEDYNKAVETYD